MTNFNNNHWINRSDEDGFTELHHAAQRGNVHTVSFLLDEYAQEIDLNRLDNQGFTPLYWSLKNNHTQISKILIKNGATITESDIKELASQNKISDKKVIKSLLFKHIVDSPEIMYLLLQNLEQQKSRMHIQDRILLFCNAASSAPKNFKSLLKICPKLTTAKDKEGYTSLHLLSMHLLEIQDLLSDAKTTEAINLLESARDNIIKAIRSLIQEGADIKQIGPDGFTPRTLLKEGAGEAGKEILQPKQCCCCTDPSEHIISITKDIRRFTI